MHCTVFCIQCSCIINAHNSLPLFLPLSFSLPPFLSPLPPSLSFLPPPPLPLSLPSHIATMLKSKDYQTIVGGVQMAHILMEKLPNIFLISFHREGVVHEVKALRSSPLRLIATPRKEIQSPLSSSSTAPLKSPPTASVAAATAQTTPPGSTHSSTRKYVEQSS